MSIVELKSVSFRYGGAKNKYAISNLSLSVEEGEFIAIVGHNGSGKSTLAKLMNGLLEPTSGDVIVDGINTRDDDKIYDVRKTVGVVFQNPDNQMVATIIEDDVAFGPENLGLKREEIGERVDYALKSVGMEEYRKREPSLSGGQKQRIAIAGVLAIKPRVLILDESTAMLDPPGREEIMRVVDKLRKESNMTVITVTHFMEEAQSADRIIVLNGGKMIMQGKPEEVFSQSDKLRQAGLIPPLYVRVRDALKDKLDLPEVEARTNLRRRYVDRNQKFVVRLRPQSGVFQTRARQRVV